MKNTLKFVLTVTGVYLAIGGAAVPANAQKKGASTPSSTAASPSASSAAASPSAAPASSGPLEEQMLAYWSLDQIVEKLARYSCPTATENKASQILILDSPTLQALQAFDSFYTNAEALSMAFQKMYGASGTGGSGIDDFADISNAVAAAATASNTETSSSFTIPDPTVALMLLRHMQKVDQCPQQLYGGLYSVNAGAPTVGGKTLNSVETELASLSGARVKALGSVIPKMDAHGKLTNNPLVPCVATLAPISNGNKTVLAASSTDPCFTAFNSLDATYNAFLTGLSSANLSTGQPGLTSILQGYRLRGLFGTTSKDRPMLGVYLSMVAAGGTQQDRKNLLTNLFTGDWIRYSGGVSVNTIVFLIAGENSKILYSDLVRYRTPLEKIQKPAGYARKGSAGDNLESVPVAGSGGTGTGQDAATQKGMKAKKASSHSAAKSNP